MTLLVAARTLSFLLALWISDVCGVNVKCGSKVISRILGFLLRGKCSPYNPAFGCMWCSWWSGVRRVIEDLDGATDILFVCN